jgi:8-oxo-dGTP pyrophosphatase MutT (NUDIX family)
VLAVSTVDFTTTLPRKRMGAGVLIRHADDDRVLLVEPTYKDRWEVPGGVVEADESPYAAAARELTEELGLVIAPGRLLVVDWVAPRDGRTEGIMFVYDGGTLDPATAAGIVLPDGELRGWAWSTPEQADTRLLPVLARRVAAARQAVRDGGTRYLEDGYPIP